MVLNSTSLLQPGMLLVVESAGASFTRQKQLESSTYGTAYRTW